MKLFSVYMIKKIHFLVLGEISFIESHHNLLEIQFLCKVRKTVKYVYFYLLPGEGAGLRKGRRQSRC